MTKLAGCLMIFGACGLFLWGQLRERYILLHTVRELQDAMERIATAIRWQEQSLPRAIATLTEGRYTGILFQKINAGMKSERTLQSLWISTFATLPMPLRDILVSIRLQGDREHLLRQFDRAADELGRYEALLRGAETDRRKLLCATSLAGATVLILLLL